jgi:hypothetical protein
VTLDRESQIPMSTKPLAALISARGFDDFQPGLKARFRRFRLRYALTYCKPTDDSEMQLDFESALHRGRVTAWESGACRLEVLEISSGRVVFLEHHQLGSAEEFHSVYPSLVLFMRDALVWPKGTWKPVS